MNALAQSVEPLIGVKEAAEILGVSRRTIANRLREIPHMRIGTRVLFLASILDEWRREQIRMSAPLVAANGKERK